MRRFTSFFGEFVADFVIFALGKTTWVLWINVKQKARLGQRDNRTDLEIVATDTVIINQKLYQKARSG